ncbi:MAG: DUF5686 and carboxypeptidase-like regulatory domain-containing protein [Melioribacteraceae bacterium]
MKFIRKIRPTIFSIILLLSTQLNLGQTLSGKVTNIKNEPIPYVNVFCVELNTGTSTNIDGEFNLKVSPGNWKIILSNIGFYNDTVDVHLKPKEEKTIIVKLEEKIREMQTIYVYDSSLSEAERIILRTIATKNEYLEKIKNYEYNAYDKTVISFVKKDSVIIGGIMETQIKGYYQNPDMFNEVILSKKQTKNLLPMTNNFFTMGRIPNVMEEELRIDELAIISPLNSNALKYYSYKIADTTFFYDKKVFIIEFEPKNKVLPLFSGRIGIIDNAYTPVLLTLKGTNSIITSRSKEIEIEEKFSKLNNEYWLPICVIQKSILNFNFPSFPKFYLNHTWLLSDYKINSTNFDYEFTNNIQTEKLLTVREAEKLWSNNQSILLTKEETKAMAKIDSVIENASLFQKAFFGLFRISFEGFGNLPLTNFNDFYHFNRVEGHYGGIGIQLNSIIPKTELALKIGYGFSDKKTKFNFSINHSMNPFSLKLDFYNDLQKLDPFFNYSTFDLTYQSWMEKNDFSDYYYSRGISAQLNYSIDKNFLISAGFSSRKDKSAKVNTNWSLFYKNDSYRPQRNINEGNISNYSITLRFDNKKFYDLAIFRLPDYTYDFIDTELKTTRGFYSQKTKDSFWQIRLRILGIINTSGIINPRYTILAGYNSGKDLYQNRFHLPGMFAYTSSMNSFTSIKNDDYLGNKYLCLFLENNFRNILFKAVGIPFLKEKSYDFILFGKYAWLKDPDSLNEPFQVYEIGFSFANIFSFFRLDFTWRLASESKPKFFITLGSLIPF